MKKKNEEKQQKILKIIKIIGCSLGLLLCGGAFIGLLFVGIRGCVSQNNKEVVSATTTNINKRKLTTSKVINIEDIDGVNYYPYVLGGYDLFNHYPPKVVNTGVYENTIDTYINGVKRTHYSLSVSSLGGLVRNGYGFYNYDENNLQSDYIELNYVFTGDSPMETFSNGIKAGDIFYFQSERFDYLKNRNSSYFNNLFSSNVFRPYENVNITFNNVINPFGPLGSNYSIINSSSITGEKLLFKGLFTDLTGETYKSIKLWYLSATGMSYGTASSYNNYTGDGCYFLGLYYINLNDDEIYVNGQDFALATYGSHEGGPVLIGSNHWISSMFQTIKILTIENDENYLTPTYDRLVAVTSLNNNVNGNSVYDAGGTIGGTNPFILIGSAFSSLIPLLNITIIPGLTIGTLLLVPLVGMIVLFVVFLFKR